MADMFYNGFFEAHGDGTIDMDSHVFKVVLLTDAYTPNAAHTGYSSVSANEVANGNGYTTGGKTLTNISWAQTGGIGKFDSDDPIWTGATITARYAALYDDTAAGKDLLFMLDFLQNKSSSAADFSITVDANGWFRFAVKGAI